MNNNKNKKFNKKSNANKKASKKFAKRKLRGMRPQFGLKDQMLSAPLSQSSRIFNDAGSVPSTRIKKREFVMDVNPTSSRFKLRRDSNGLITAIADIIGNVGLGTAFPWLSKIAPAFENFVIHTLNFDYKTSCPTSQPGSIALVPSYDATEAVPEEKTEYMSKVGTVRGPLWGNHKVPIDVRKCYSQLKSHKVRTSDVDLAEKDQKMYDPFKMSIILDEAAANTLDNLGEVWVEYDVELKIPKNNSQDLTPLTAYGLAQTTKINCDVKTKPKDNTLDVGDDGLYGVIFYMKRPMARYLINFNTLSTSSNGIAKTSTTTNYVLAPGWQASTVNSTYILTTDKKANTSYFSYIGQFVIDTSASVTPELPCSFTFTFTNFTGHIQWTGSVSTLPRPFLVESTSGRLQLPENIDLGYSCKPMPVVVWKRDRKVEDDIDESKLSQNGI